MNDDLSRQSLRRYARHLVLPEIGEAGQETLLASRVLVIGAGGLGSAAIAYLAAMGVGEIHVADHDRVELSNLQRQVLFEEADIGRAKVEAARDRVEEVNPDCRLIAHGLRLDETNAMPLVERVDAVIDGSDNFATRFAVADACMQAKKPLISAAVTAFSGQISTFTPYLGHPHPCYRCLVHSAPERERSCAQEGIIGALAGVMGSMQALEAVKALLGIGVSLSGRLMIYDALSARFRETQLPRDTRCLSGHG